MRRVGHLLSLATLLFVAAPARADFDGLLARLPEGANLLMMVNADQMFASELATSEGWSKKYDENFGDAPLMLPPGATKFVMGSRLDLATFTPEWEAAAVRLKADLPMGAVARLVGGRAEEVGGLPAVASQRNDYVLKFGDAEFGMMRPANRQRTARWAREAASASVPTLSDYLSKASIYPDRAGTEIILAVDLADSVGEQSIRAAAAASPVLRKKGVDPIAAADALVGLQGLTLGVKVSDKAYGSLRVDFAGPIDAIKPVAKDLLLEVFEEAGMAIDEFYDWEVQVAENGFRISGPFTTSGLRRVFSLLELDATAVGGAEESADAAVDSGEPAVDPYASQDYFKGVTKYLRDLKMETGAKSYYSIARWFEKYAKRIDRLPILGVDPELLDYSSKVVQQLRDCGGAIRGAGIRTGGRSAGVTGGSNLGYDNTGYQLYSVFQGSTYSSYQQGQDAIRNAETQRRAIRGQERARSSTDVRTIVRQIQDETSNIRREMTQKHGIEF